MVFFVHSPAVLAFYDVVLYDVVAFYDVPLLFVLFCDAVVFFFSAVEVAATDLVDLARILSYTRVFLADEQIWQMPCAHPLSSLFARERNHRDCITCSPGPCT